MKASVSARKIGANLWEVEPIFNFKKLNSNQDDDDEGDQRHYIYQKEGLVGEEEPSDNNSKQPHASSMGRTLKTSKHLLKVLNQTSNLEKQHSRDMVLIKSLKRDLDISRAQIKTLVEERKRDHQEINELKRSTHEKKEKAVQSRKDELLEVKYDLMQEKKTRILLENLCDEFAKCITDYERKVRFLQQKCREKDQIVSRNKLDRLILHVSEAWLDERLHTKHDFAEKPSISDKLCCEIETFLNSGVDILEDCEENRSSSSESESRVIDSAHEPTEPSLESTLRMTYQGPGVDEPSSQPRSRTTVQAPGVVESSTRQAQAHVGVKAKTLMAKLVEARLESQFSKSRRARRR